MVRKIYWASLSSILLLGLCFIACQSPSPNKEVRLTLDWIPNPNHVAIFVGIEKGFFAQNDISLELQKIHDACDPIPALINSQTELAISYMPSAVVAMENGAKIKPIGILIPEPLNAFIYRKNSQITSIKDFNGKIFGYCQGSSTLTPQSLDLLIKMNQLEIKDKRNLNFDLVVALKNKRVDVLYGAFWNIECEQLRSMGVETEYMKLTDLGYPPYCELVILARSDSIYASAEYITKFAESLQMSIDFCQKYPEEAFEIYMAANPEKGEKSRAWEYESWKKTLPLYPKTQHIDEIAWNQFADWLRSH